MYPPNVIFFEEDLLRNPSHIRHAECGATRITNHYPGPEPPRTHPRNAECYLNRAYRPGNSYQNSYNDAFQYMYSRQPDPSYGAYWWSSRSCEYAGLNLRFGLDGGRNRDPATSRRNRMRNWFRNVDRGTLMRQKVCLKGQETAKRKYVKITMGTGYGIMK